MTQRSYDPLDYLDKGIATSHAQAKLMARQARDAELKALRHQYRALNLPRRTFFGWSLPGQIRKYESFGVPDGSSRTVYYITGPDSLVPHGRAVV